MQPWLPHRFTKKPSASREFGVKQSVGLFAVLISPIIVFSQMIAINNFQLQKYVVAISFLSAVVAAYRVYLMARLRDWATEREQDLTDLANALLGSESKNESIRLAIGTLGLLTEGTGRSMAKDSSGQVIQEEGSARRPSRLRSKLRSGTAVSSKVAGNDGITISVISENKLRIELKELIDKVASQLSNTLEIHALREQISSEKVYAKISEMAQDSSEVIFLLDSGSNKVKFVGPTVEKLFGTGVEIYPNSSPFSQVHEGDRPKSEQLLRLAHDSERSVQSEVRVITAEGIVKWFNLSIRKMTNKDTVDILVSFTDIHDRKIAQHAARHDPLTGLLNRSELFRRSEKLLEQSKANQTGVAVIFLDLNKFKEVNDSLGHDAGDELLKITAQRLKDSIRTDDIVARYGGDEFVVVCAEVAEEKVGHRIAQDIAASLSRPLGIDRLPENIPSSIGVALSCFTANPKTADLIRQADEAMFQAKRAGSGYVMSKA